MPIAEPEPEPEPEPVRTPAKPVAAPESEASFDRDAVLGEVFKPMEEPEIAAPATKAASAKTADAPSSIMQEMISVMRDSMRDTYAMLARRMELFRGLDPEVVARIFSKGMTVEFEAGQTIFEKGAPGEKLYAILGGKVDIVNEGRRIATLNRGDMFGEMALICNEPRSASAVAVETTSVLELTFEVFENILPKEAALQLLVNIVVTLSDRLRTANDIINRQLK
jgi:CRP-like cAMP-binding protein